MLLSELIRLSKIELNLEAGFDPDIKAFAIYKADIEGAIGYVGSATFMRRVLGKENFVCILMPKDLPKKDDRCILVENPEDVFYRLYLAWHSHQTYANNCIADSAVIHPSAVLDDCGVQIGAHTTIAAGTVISRGTVIGQHCYIGANSTIGGDGFMVKYLDGRKTVVPHDGLVRIGDYVTIGRQCNIDKGFLGIDTVIGDETKLDAMVHVGHGVQMGRKNTIAAGVTIGGFVAIADNNFIGLNAVLSNDICVGSDNFIGMNQSVARNIRDGKRLTLFSRG